jgi:hypothetical protein
MEVIDRDGVLVMFPESQGLDPPIPIGRELGVYLARVGGLEAEVVELHLFSLRTSARRLIRS